LPHVVTGGTFRLFMNTARTTKLLTRAIAGSVIVPQDGRLSWLVSMNCSTIGKQEERI